MNFDDAVAAHSAWKLKLSGYLSKRDGSLNPSEAALDTKCPLGKWIYGEGTKYGTMPEYSRLKSHHACFHKAVGDVIRRADAGESVVAEVALGAKSDFGRASSAVVAAIMNMKYHATK